MMASPALRGLRRAATINPYPSAKLREVFAKQVCSYAGSNACRFCQAKTRNGGVCPSATHLGLDGRR
jgi:hypothetical protein